MLRSFIRFDGTVVRQQFRNFSNKKTAKNATKTIIPGAALGALGYICYRHYYRVVEREEQKAGIYREVKPYGYWKTKFYVSLPRKIQSRIWGYVHSLTLPEVLREPLIGLFVSTFECDLSEAKDADLKNYKNLDDFFRRQLKPNIRPISSDCLVSPADGRVDRVGEVLNNKIEQVKHITYEVSAFVGEDLAAKHSSDPSKKLFYCVVYLAPGDYHGFHSPADWIIKHRRHFSGHLLGVSQKVTSRIANLFCINERVLLTGNWMYGFFSMTPVGATNVGNIGIDFDETLITNLRSRKVHEYEDKHYDNSVKKVRGERIGEFRFGSTIVLLFEAPKDFQFVVQSGQKIKFGQTLGRIASVQPR